MIKMITRSLDEVSDIRFIGVYTDDHDNLYMSEPTSIIELKKWMNDIADEIEDSETVFEFNIYQIYQRVILKENGSRKSERPS